MRITVDETTTQVLVKAYTTLLLEDFTMQVGRRTARIKKATVHWMYLNGGWQIDFVHVWGPVIRKSDGAESSQHVSEGTRPAGADGSAYGVVTPQEIVDVALANTPDWIPEINGTTYPRTAKLKSSL
ncbi:hypothetical protein ABT026_25360 [Streptomyces sp. NPDC002734]|uniref:hypothetical protein n=1 Tax=Streptomyces sp. NPDC002734 TaxID=3154426 RepID=UPI0033263F55